MTFLPGAALALFLSAPFALTVDALATEQPFAADAELTAAALWTEIEARHPSLAAMQATLAAASARTEQADALDDPMLMTKLAPDSLRGDTVAPSYMLEWSQRLPWPGKRAARRELAQREQQGLQAGRELLRLQLQSMSAAAHADWWQAGAAFGLNQQAQALWQQTQNVTQARYISGQASQQELLATELAQVQLQRARLGLMRQQRAAATAINTLLARVPDAALPPAALPAALAETLPDWSRVQALMLERHPVLSAHASYIRAAEQEQHLAELNAYPDFELRAGYDRFWDEPELRGSLALTINLPFGGKRAAAKREAHAKVQAAHWALADQRNQLLSDLSAAHGAVAEAQAVRSLYRTRLLPLAEQNHASALNSYRAGAGAFLAVQEAQRSLLDTRQGLLDTETALLRAWAELSQAAGGAKLLSETAVNAAVMNPSGGTQP